MKQLCRTGTALIVSDLVTLVPWVTAEQSIGRNRAIRIATFIVDLSEQLWIADRRSEHVACADGQDLLATGEITFEVALSGIIATEITNQSTGYCPEPKSSEFVAVVLDRLQILRPNAFTTEFQFHQCDHCGAINLIKEGVFTELAKRLGSGLQNLSDWFDSSTQLHFLA